MSVVEAITRELAKLPEDVRESALAASALVMAQGLDNPGNSLTSQSMAQGRLQDAMDRLHALAPPKQERDDLDEIAAARARRLASRSAASAN